jgi:hypothetical protein
VNLVEAEDFAEIFVRLYREIKAALGPIKNWECLFCSILHKLLFKEPLLTRMFQAPEVHCRGHFIDYLKKLGVIFTDVLYYGPERIDEIIESPDFLSEWTENMRESRDKTSKISRIDKLIGLFNSEKEDFKAKLKQIVKIGMYNPLNLAKLQKN